MRGRVSVLAAVCLAFAAPVQAEEAKRSILFIGNSFTQGSNSAVLRYRPQSVEGRVEADVGGIPALYARFAEQMGQPWRVVHVTRGGASLSDHIRDRLPLMAGTWDVAVMQEYSTLDPKRPGNAEMTAKAAPQLARHIEAANPGAQIFLMATWSRADQIYTPAGHWYGRPVDSMARDVQRALDAVDTASDAIDGVIPVGAAWNRAMAAGVADPNPYDGTSFGQVDLWSYDQYHASAAGSYLEALVVFGRVTGTDPRRLGAGERAAHEIGLDPRVTEALQRVAAEELGLAGGTAP